MPGGGAIDFVYLGSGGGPIRSTDDAIANEVSAFFRRPVDIGALVRRLESLTGGPSVRPDVRPSTPPPSIAQHPKSAPPDRGSSPSLPAPGARDQGPPLPMSTDMVDTKTSRARKLVSTPTVSCQS